MSKCPNCEKNCVPLWRAFVMPSLAPAFACPCCGVKIYRARSWFDVVAFVPLLLANAFIYLGDTKSAQEAWLCYAGAVVAGVVLWVPLIRYRVFLGKILP